MNIHFSQNELQGEAGKPIIQAVQKQAQEAAEAAINPVMTAFLE